MYMYSEPTGLEINTEPPEAGDFSIERENIPAIKSFFYLNT